MCNTYFAMQIKYYYKYIHQHFGFYVFDNRTKKKRSSNYIVQCYVVGGRGRNDSV